MIKSILSSTGAWLLCIATILGFAGQFHWSLDLFSHFRVQYLFGLLIYAVWFKFSRSNRNLLICLVFLLLNFLAILPLYLPEHTADEPNPKIRLLHFNIHTRNRQFKKTLDLISETRPDVVVIEEVNALWLENLMPLVKTHPWWIAHPREDNFGISLFSRLPLKNQKISDFSGIGLPTILASIKTQQADLLLAATHPLPPVGPAYADVRDRQLAGLAEFATMASSPFVIAGDLNATPWSHTFKSMLAAGRLHDSSRGFGFQPSWPTHNPLLLIPIDHFIHNDHIRVTNRFIGPDCGSDHLPLIVDFSIR